MSVSPAYLEATISLPDTGGTSFETEHMRQLYRYGYDKARAGSFWEMKPPLEATKATRKDR